MATTPCPMAENSNMRLWLLRPAHMGQRPSEDTYDDEKGPWDPWYDKAFGFVVEAESEEEARQIADDAGLNEREARSHDRNQGYGAGKVPTWTNPELVRCEELAPTGTAGVVIADQRWA